MKNHFFKLIFVVWLFSCLAAKANTEMEQFVYEFHALESQQVLLPKPFSYNDPIYGPKLKKLLEPERIKSLLSQQNAAKDKLGFAPLLELIQPISARYENAYARDNKNYEFEYLDVLDVFVYTLNKNALNSQTQASKTSNNPLSPEDLKLLDSFNQMRDSLKKMMESTRRAYASGIKEKIKTEKFSRAGQLRAEQLIVVLLDGLPKVADVGLTPLVSPTTPPDVNSTINMELRQYSSELHQLESQQALSPSEPFVYADSVYGLALKKLLLPARVKHVMQLQMQEYLKNGLPEIAIEKQIQLIHGRYNQAFRKNPVKYEIEHLDCLEASQSMMLVSTGMQQSAAMLETQKALTPQEKKMTEELASSVKGMVQGFLGMVANFLRKDIEKGMFSPLGKERAESVHKILLEGL